MNQHTVILNPKTPSVSTVTLAQDEIPKAIVLRRNAFELCELDHVDYGDYRLPHKVISEGDEMKYTFELGMIARIVPQVLTLTWRAKGKQARHISYEVETKRVVELDPLAATIAESMQCEPERFETILSRVAERYKVDSRAVLEFFGEDGFSTVEQETIEALTKRAEETKRPVGDLLAATILSGVARTVSERAEFDSLRREGTDETKPDDFKVEAKTVSESPKAISLVDETATLPNSERQPQLTAGVAPPIPDKSCQELVGSERQPPPTAGAGPTVGDLMTLANALDVDSVWAKSAIRIISDLRRVKPNDIVTKGLKELRLLSTFNGRGYDVFQRASVFLDSIAQTVPTSYRASD